MKNDIAVDILPVKNHLTDAEPVLYRTQFNKVVPKCAATR